ncbi:hypothetical protein BRADI_3g22015v3 [Brachypodium distachyon]|uniref:Uncharacterized protein n=1 Tax=Brachypodium distachyon TaxID=15368 RepID=A0A0Q3I6X6_BRADI|nr:hypothetical protein BRADI_3g22015v3 [Brachypodium distachyon]
MLFPFYEIENGVTRFEKKTRRCKLCERPAGWEMLEPRGDGNLKGWRERLGCPVTSPYGSFLEMFPVMP